MSTPGKLYDGFPAPNIVPLPARVTACDANKLITVKEPTALFWDDYYCNVKKPYNIKFVPPFPDGKDVVRGNAFWSDDTNGAWIPPNQAGRFWKDWYFAGSNGAYGPGFHKYLDSRYNPTYNDVAKKLYPGVRLGHAPGNNEMDNWEFKRARPWKEHLHDCCNGKINDPELCGEFNIGSKTRWDEEHCGAGQLNFFADCSVDDIMNKNPNKMCNELCKREPHRCEWLKKKHCAENPKDDRCACLLREQDSSFMEKKAMLHKHGLVIPDMCYNVACSTSIDLENALLTQNDIENQKRINCADTKYDIKITDISGDSNVVDVTQTGGGNNDGKPTVPGVPSDLDDPNNQSGTTDTGSGNQVSTNNDKKKEKPIWVKYWWVILLIIVVLLYRAYSDDEDNQYEATRTIAPI